MKKFYQNFLLLPYDNFKKMRKIIHPSTVSIVSWHTLEQIEQADSVPPNYFFVEKSRCATDGCATSLYIFLNKQVCQCRTCQNYLFCLGFESTR